jgi:hypothetical protein
LGVIGDEEQLAQITICVSRLTRVGLLPSIYELPVCRWLWIPGSLEPFKNPTLAHPKREPVVRTAVIRKCLPCQDCAGGIPILGDDV